MGTAFRAPRLITAVRKQLPYLGPVLAWLAVIAWCSTDAASSVNTTDPFLRAAWRLLFHGREPGPAEAELLSRILRKSLHVFEYAVLALLIYRWLDFSWPAARPLLAATSVAISAGCATVDELHQLLVPSRTGALGDVGFDAAGAALGTLAMAYWLSRSRTPRAKEN